MTARRKAAAFPLLALTEARSASRPTRRPPTGTALRFAPLAAAPRRPQAATTAGGQPPPVPAAVSGTDASVLTPIAAGLLLAAIAAWKHRGLPTGH